MRHPFYDDPTYKQKQAQITHKYWQQGTFALQVKPLEERFCENPDCTISFQVKPHDKKRYCSCRCAALVNNQGRTNSPETRQKISLAQKRYAATHPNFILRLVPGARKKVDLVTLVCINCQKEFQRLPHIAKRQKYCSNACVMQTVGRQTTSPKASKGKPGVRPDIDPAICFYSTWEANIARVFILVGIVWQYAPKIFDLGQHTYRPDFYLPKDGVFIEVKNFMGVYSLERDQLFRKLYPRIRLDIIGKEEYKQIEQQYKPLIDFWES